MASRWDSYSFGIREEALSWMDVAGIGVESTLTCCTCFWLAVRIGLQARSSARGIMLTFLAVCLWFAAFPLLFELKSFLTVHGLLTQDNDWTAMLGAFSGYHLCATLAGADRTSDLPALMIGWGFNLAFCTALRSISMRYARRWLSLQPG